MSAKISTFIVLNIKVIKTLLMCKGTSKSSIHQEKMLFSLPEMVSDKKIRVDFDSPDISSNGGLVLIGNMHNSLAWQIGQLIPDSRKKEFIHHTYMEMVSQRIGQILCGYKDANDCNQLRGDSHFASHEFMDWAHDRWYVRYLTGLSGNSVLLSMVDKPRRRAESDYRKAQEAEDERYETLTRLGFRGVRQTACRATHTVQTTSACSSMGLPLSLRIG